MDFELQYLLKKINCINHPVWHDKKDAVIWILLNFINNNLNEELIYKPISLLKVKIKYIKKYMHCTKDIVYIEELLDKYETEKITSLENLSILIRQIENLTEYVDDLYNKSLKNNDILYFDDNLDEYIEVLDLEATSKIPVINKNLDIDDEAIEILKDLEKTLILDNPVREDDIEILDFLEKTTKLNPEQLKNLNINDETIEILKDLEKTLIFNKPIKEEDIEVLDYLDRTIKFSKINSNDINDDNIEILKDLEKTLVLNKSLINEEVEILDYLDKTIQIPKLTKKELKKLDVNDETIEVLDFLEKTRKFPTIREIELTKDELSKLKSLEKTVKINRYQITDSMLKEIERRKKVRKVTFITTLSILCFAFFISSYRIIAWHKNNIDLKEEIDNITANVEIKEFDEDNNVIENENDIYLTESFIDVDFDELMKTNSDTIGWIYVPGTNIDYPFVQTTDNKYYLSHSFSKNYNEAGWVFMDYRNSSYDLDLNTIIYAHGRLDKTMFGSLRNALEENWYLNEDNHFIKISMVSNNTLWQVFSVYKIETETYYLKNNFTSYENHKEFIETIKNRSIYDFDINVTTDDKILTLSTCYDNFNKVVVHAKMIRQYNK